MRKAMYTHGFMVVLASLSATVKATAVAPEIDGGSLASGIGLLTGGMLMLRSRFARK